MVGLYIQVLKKVPGVMWGIAKGLKSGFSLISLVCLLLLNQSITDYFRITNYFPAWHGMGRLWALAPIVMLAVYSFLKVNYHLFCELNESRSALEREKDALRSELEREARRVDPKLMLSRTVSASRRGELLLENVAGSTQAALNPRIKIVTEGLDFSLLAYCGADVLGPGQNSPVELYAKGEGEISPVLKKFPSTELFFAECAKIQQTSEVEISVEIRYADGEGRSYLNTATIVRHPMGDYGIRSQKIVRDDWLPPSVQ